MSSVQGGKPIRLQAGDTVYEGYVKSIACTSEFGGDTWEIEFVPQAGTHDANRLEGEARQRDLTLIPNEQIKRGEIVVAGETFVKVTSIGDAVPEEEEQSMPNAIIHPNPRTRTADISIEVREDVFLDADGSEVERDRAQEMPVYIEDMPLDVLSAIQRSGNVVSGGMVNVDLVTGRRI